MKTFLRAGGFILLGVLGGFLFELLFFPLILAQPWIDQWPLFKNLSRNVVNYPTQQIIIQEGDSLKTAIKQAVGTVVAVGKKGETTGSGFALTSDGLVVLDTALVPSGASSLLIDNQLTNFKFLTADLKKGLTLIKLDNKNFKTTSLLDNENLEVGEKVFVLKKVFSTATSAVDSLEFAKIANEGIVKRKNDNLETNIKEEAGFGLAPAFNFKGDFVGMARLDNKGYLSIIPADVIRALAEKP
jgi:S1-C subfamily serine protease